MQQRMDIATLLPNAFRAMAAFDQAVKESGIDPHLLHLVKLRASQINGCGYCVDMHVKESLADGMNPQMLHLVSDRVRVQHLRNQGSETHLDRVLRFADPANPTVLTIGFARRFATYKRANLLANNIDWLKEILTNAQHPILFIFAGKAHPADVPGQQLIKEISQLSRQPEFEGRILLVELM